jgi:hypothetical protein
MQTSRIRTVSALVFLLAGAAAAAPPPETSLNNCQNAVKTATKAFVTNKVTAIGACLQAVSTQIVKKNAPDAGAVAGACVTQFRRLNDSRGAGKSLPEKLTAAIGAKCTPGGTNTHTLADIIGTGAGVAQPLDAENLNAWCAHYGGDGSIDSLQEWIDCIDAAAECDAASAVASQYPRAIEWLNLVKPSMQAVSPPAADPTKVTDAVAGLDAVKAELDGPDNDNAVSIQCGGIVSTGTASAGDVLGGKTFSNSSGSGLTGTMPNNGAVTLTPTTADQAIAAGYHNGSGKCAGDADLVSGNIRSGVDLFGVNGDSNVVNTSSGDAVAGDLLSGKIAWVDGAQVTGTMPDNGAVMLTPSTSDQAIAAGYHNGSGTCAGDADLVSGNIKSGVSLFGVNGSSSVVDTGSATAAAADMVSGKTAYVNGSLVTGTVPAGANVNGANGLETFTIPDGLYSGSKTATANDTNLTASNISNGVTILGVTGTALPAQALQTGQTACYDASGTVIACAGTGQDGELQKGLARAYVDNGDGTITDTKTGLMWEKLSGDGSIHDYNTLYTWTNAFTKITSLNTASFAGHTDWRLPNANELQTLAKIGALGPAIDAAFNTNCVGSCTPLTCSCTRSNGYWSSSTFQGGPTYAWIVYFDVGYVYASGKTLSLYVRGVRGGL